jgi:D-lyxose ketol-isomerase
MGRTTQESQQWAAGRLTDAGIAVADGETAAIEVTDFGRGSPERVGLQVLVYVNTERVCAKEMVFRPWQICPEHRHPPQPDNVGKEETFRCRAGEAYVYLPGEPTTDARARVDDDLRGGFTVWNETVLRPGDEVTVPPDTLHWIQAGPEGAIVSEFSTHSEDPLDRFTDPIIQQWRTNGASDV